MAAALMFYSLVSKLSCQITVLGAEGRSIVWLMCHVVLHHGRLYRQTTFSRLHDPESMQVAHISPARLHASVVASLT